VDALCVKIQQCAKDAISRLRPVQLKTGRINAPRWNCSIGFLD